MHIYCEDHKRQWLVILSFLVFTVAGGTASLYSILAPAVDHARERSDSEIAYDKGIALLEHLPNSGNLQLISSGLLELDGDDDTEELYVFYSDITYRNFCGINDYPSILEIYSNNEPIYSTTAFECSVGIDVEQIELSSIHKFVSASDRHGSGSYLQMQIISYDGIRKAVMDADVRTLLGRYYSSNIKVLARAGSLYFVNSGMRLEVQKENGVLVITPDYGRMPPPSDNDNYSLLSLHLENGEFSVAWNGRHIDTAVSKENSLWLTNANEISLKLGDIIYFDDNFGAVGWCDIFSDAETLLDEYGRPYLDGSFDWIKGFYDTVRPLKRGDHSVSYHCNSGDTHTTFNIVFAIE
jgi:hypothetical protein